jgi:glycine hydroxymethyltransferase
MQGGPLMHVIAAKAVASARRSSPASSGYAAAGVEQREGARRDARRKAGLRLVSGGTDNHLILVDVTPFGLTGNVAEKALEEAGITVNKNMIPFDQHPATKTSGVRVGTPALTTRGMGVDEMKRVGAWIAWTLKNAEDEAGKARVRAEVKEMTASFPLHDADAFAPGAAAKAR